MTKVGGGAIHQASMHFAANSNTRPDVLWPEEYRQILYSTFHKIRTQSDPFQAALPFYRTSLRKYYQKRSRKKENQTIEIYSDKDDDLFVFMVHYFSYDHVDPSFGEMIDYWHRNFGEASCRPVFLLCFDRTVADHRAILCGTWVYHLSNIGTADGHYQKLAMTRKNFQSMKLIGKTRFSDAEIDMICYRNLLQVKKDNKKKDFILVCLKEICVNDPEALLTSPSSSSWLSEAAKVTGIIVVAALYMRWKMRV